MAVFRQLAVVRVWLFVAAVALGLLIMALALVNYFAEKRLVRQLEQDPLALASQERLTRWTIDVHLAGLEQELLRLARVADLKEAIVKGDPTELRDQLEPPLNRLRKGPLQISRLTLYSPEGVAFLRAHAPASRGDSVLDRRPLIAETMRARRILKGAETEDGLPYLWVATPIYHNGRVVGILEIGSSLAPIVKVIEMITEGDVAMVVGGDRPQVIESSAPQLFQQAAPRLAPMERVASRRVLVLDEKTYAITLVPLTDFSGKSVGCVALLSDVSGVAEILQKSNALTFAISVLGFVLAVALLLVLILRRDRV